MPVWTASTPRAKRRNRLGLGVPARCRALLSDAPDKLYEEAIDRLAGTRVAVQLTGAHLLHGEWLARSGARAQARASPTVCSTAGASRPRAA
ncbi:hypothetical protein ACFQ0B_55730 [Nonomuraea thailandensis]